MRPLLLLGLAISAGCTTKVVVVTDAGQTEGEVDTDAEGDAAPDDEAEPEVPDAMTPQGLPRLDAGGGLDASAWQEGGTPANPAASAADSATLDGATTDAGVLPAGACPNPLRRTKPDFHLVVDRSGSMRPSPQGMNCLNPDFINALACQSAGIDCTDPAQVNRIECGGNMAPLDLWTPAVSVLKTYAEAYQAEINFSLTIFPGVPAMAGATDPCMTGTESVAVGAATATAIGSALDMTTPAGATPTGPTLQALRGRIEARKAQLGAELPPQYVVLVTDGAPNCGNDAAGTAAHHAALAALDALAALGVKTFVVGFEGATDPKLMPRLMEYAQRGGTGSAHAVQAGPSFSPGFHEVTRNAAACSYGLSAELTAAQSLELDGRALTRDAADGFRVSGKSVQLSGAACTTLRDTSRTHTLSMTPRCTLD